MNRPIAARLSRRQVLLGVAGLGAAGALGLSGLWAPGQPGTQLASRLALPPPYQVPLPIPPVLAPTSTDYYEITQQRRDMAILPGVTTSMWTYAGHFPGPTIVSRSGRRTVVRHHNELPVATVTHLHGGHTPPDSDGYPTDLVLPTEPGHTSASQRSTSRPDSVSMAAAAMPGMPADPHAQITLGQRDYIYPLDQRAATLWYHDHRMGFTGASVWRGLAGFHLVHDEQELALPLPQGERDIPLMLTDRAFAADGQLLYPALDPTLMHTPGVTAPYTGGVTGDVILVNGAPWPVLEAAGARYRLRILNASNARNYRLALRPPPPGGAGLVQIGADGGLLTAPIAHDTLDIVPAQRFDVIIDFARYRPGTRVEMVNLLGAGPTSRVLGIRVGAATGDDTVIPPRLSTIEPLDPATAAVTRDFLFRNSGVTEGWTINGQPFDPARADATPRLGQVEIWRFITDFAHPIHLHLTHFQVLSRNGGPPGPYDQGWKDTVELHPAEGLEIITRFTDYPGRYVFHCHNLEHEDMAMMANLVTT
jgi:spore coat protein A, manganese oxidase